MKGLKKEQGKMENGLNHFVQSCLTVASESVKPYLSIEPCYTQKELGTIERIDTFKCVFDIVKTIQENRVARLIDYYSNPDIRDPHHDYRISQTRQLRLDERDITVYMEDSKLKSKIDWVKDTKQFVYKVTLPTPYSTLYRNQIVKSDVYIIGYDKPDYVIYEHDDSIWEPVSRFHDPILYRRHVVKVVTVADYLSALYDAITS